MLVGDRLTTLGTVAAFLIQDDLTSQLLFLLSDRPQIGFEAAESPPCRIFPLASNSEVLGGGLFIGGMGGFQTVEGFPGLAESVLDTIGLVLAFFDALVEARQFYRPVGG